MRTLVLSIFLTTFFFTITSFAEEHVEDIAARYTKGSEASTDLPNCDDLKTGKASKEFITYIQIDTENSIGGYDKDLGAYRLDAWSAPKNMDFDNAYDKDCVLNPDINAYYLAEDVLGQSMDPKDASTCDFFKDLKSKAQVKLDYLKSGVEDPFLFRIRHGLKGYTREQVIKIRRSRRTQAQAVKKLQKDIAALKKVSKTECAQKRDSKKSGKPSSQTGHQSSD